VVKGPAPSVPLSGLSALSKVGTWISGWVSATGGGAHGSGFGAGGAAGATWLLRSAASLSAAPLVAPIGPSLVAAPGRTSCSSSVGSWCAAPATESQVSPSTLVASVAVSSVSAATASLVAATAASVPGSSTGPGSLGVVSVVSPVPTVSGAAASTSSCCTSSWLASAADACSPSVPPSCRLSLSCSCMPSSCTVAGSAVPCAESRLCDWCVLLRSPPPSSPALLGELLLLPSSAAEAASPVPKLISWPSGSTWSSAASPSLLIPSAFCDRDSSGGCCCFVTEAWEVSAAAAPLTVLPPSPFVLLALLLLPPVAVRLVLLGALSSVGATSLLAA
jgi:hypothetical protein